MITPQLLKAIENTFLLNKENKERYKKKFGIESRDFQMKAAISLGEMEKAMIWIKNLWSDLGQYQMEKKGGEIKKGHEEVHEVEKNTAERDLLFDLDHIQWK